MASIQKISSLGGHQPSVGGIDGQEIRLFLPLEATLGISSAEAKISRKIGIPLTRSGRQRKFGRSMACCVVLLIMGSILLASIALAFRWIRFYTAIEVIQWLVMEPEIGVCHAFKIQEPRGI